MDHGISSTSHGRLALAWLAAGSIAAVLFVLAQLPPLRVTVSLLAVLVVVGIGSLKLTELSLLPRLFVVLYSIPFGVTLGYLFRDEFIWWRIPPSNIALCQNHRLINEMLTMVIVGLCGLMGGFEFIARCLRMRPSVIRESGQIQPRRSTLRLPTVAVLLTLGFLFSWLHAPPKSIFQSAYNPSGNPGIDEKIGLYAAYLISYLIFLFIYVDAEFERAGSWRQRIKFGALATVLGYIIVVLQLMRGDRECAGVVVALGMLYITRPRPELEVARWHHFYQTRRLITLLIPGTVILLSFLMIGTLRHAVSAEPAQRPGIWATIIDGCRRNTWTAVSLNNLGLAADYNSGEVEYLYGRTYADYVLTLPPRAVAKAIGYERPMDTSANPAAWYHKRVSAGGMHPAVVPFRNFGIWGVLGVLFLMGSFIGFCDIHCETETFSARLLYGCVATSSMDWFWFSDMNIIRSLMGWFALDLIHRIWVRGQERDPRREADPGCCR